MKDTQEKAREVRGLLSQVYNEWREDRPAAALFVAAQIENMKAVELTLTACEELLRRPHDDTDA